MASFDVSLDLGVTGTVVTLEELEVVRRKVQMAQDLQWTASLAVEVSPQVELLCLCLCWDVVEVEGSDEVVEHADDGGQAEQMVDRRGPIDCLRHRYRWRCRLHPYPNFQEGVLSPHLEL